MTTESVVLPADATGKAFDLFSQIERLSVTMQQAINEHGTKEVFDLGLYEMLGAVENLAELGRNRMDPTRQ